MVPDALKMRTDVEDAFVEFDVPDPSPPVRRKPTKSYGYDFHSYLLTTFGNCNSPILQILTSIF